MTANCLAQPSSTISSAARWFHLEVVRLPMFLHLWSLRIGNRHVVSDLKPGQCSVDCDDSCADPDCPSASDRDCFNAHVFAVTFLWPRLSLFEARGLISLPAARHARQH